jgi:hypothetical protein
VEEVVDQVDHYSDPANWRTSKKGNPTNWIAGRNVTIWRGSSGWWSWVIGARERDGQPLWAQAEFDDIDEARRDSWAVFARMIWAEQERMR